MKIVVTGGAGFIGTDICRLLGKDHEITVFDAQKPKLNLKFKQGDITNIKDVTEALVGCDIVIHLAATLGVVNTEENPIKTLDTNTGGTRNILEACRINDVKKIILSSSSEVYGEPLKIPIEEKDRPIPITTYGVSKLAAEYYTRSYAKVYGIKYTIFRLFNVYGAEQANLWVVPEFVSKAIRNEDITIHGDGSQIRAFCYVSDVSNAFSYALEKGDNELYNIGNGTEPISIKELAQRVISVANSKSSIKFTPFEESKRNRIEIITRAPSTEKAHNDLNYKPKISLTDGLGLVVKRKRELL